MRTTAPPPPSIASYDCKCFLVYGFEPGQNMQNLRGEGGGRAPSRLGEWDIPIQVHRFPTGNAAHVDATSSQTNKGIDRASAEDHDSHRL